MRWHPLLTLALSLPFSYSVQAADSFAYFTKTTNASTLSLLNSSTGKQTGGISLGIIARSGAVYSNDGSLAFVNENTQNTLALVAYSLSTGKPVGSVQFLDGIQQVETSPTSSDLFVLSGHVSHNALIYQVDTTTFTATKVYTGPEATALALSPNGATFYLATSSALLFINGTTFQQEQSLTIPGITRITPSPDGQRLYLSANSPSPGIQVLNLQNDTIAGTIPATNSAYVAVSPDSSTIYTAKYQLGTSQATVEQVAASTLTVTKSLVVPEPAEGPPTLPLALSPSGDTLAILSQTVAPSVTLIKLPLLSVTVVEPVGNACGVAFTTAAEISVTNCLADTVDIVDVTTQALKAQYDAGPSPVTALTDQTGDVLYVLNAFGVWALSAKTGRVLNKIEFPSAVPVLPASLLALSADGKTLFAAYGAGVAEISTPTVELLGYIPGIPSGSVVDGIAASPSGNYLFVAGDSFLVLNQSTGALVASVALGVAPTFLVSSKDGSAVYFDAYNPENDYSVYMFEVASETLSSIVNLPPGQMVLSPDGNTLYVAGSPTDVQAYDTTTQTITELASPVPPSGVAVTPDGSTLVVTSYASTSLGLIPIANPVLGSKILVGGETAGISVR